MSCTGHIGHYQLIRELGSGTYAIVYQAWDGYLRRDVAIKVLRQEVLQVYQQEFLKEARVLARLNHPGIVRIIEFDIDGDIPYFVMNYVAEGSLRQRHPLGQKLSLPTVIDYVWQITYALLYLHERGVVHRDIKPENILCGEHRRIYLTDFGIASVVRRAGRQDVLPVRGTVLYMAPERFAGLSVPASDQYSLAVVVYEWLTGRFLFGGTTQEVIWKHVHIPPSEVRLIAAGVPFGVQRVLLKALAKNPEERFKDIFDFALVLNRGLNKSRTGR